MLGHSESHRIMKTRLTARMHKTKQEADSDSGFWILHFHMKGVIDGR